MRTIVIIFALILIAFKSSAQVTTYTYTGGGPQNWNVGANWSNTIADNVGEDPTLAKDVIITSPSSYTTGNVTANSGVALTINSGATLTVGASGNPKDFTSVNNNTLTVAGTLIIYGNLIVQNSLNFNITGSVIIYGSITFVNGGTLTVSGTGNLQVSGSVTGGNNSDIVTSGGGTIGIGGNLNLGGGGSSISGPNGSITVGGSCSVNGAACPATVTPIVLSYFIVSIPENSNRTLIEWATSSEENFSHFEIQRAGKDLRWNTILEVQGAGYNTNSLKEYSVYDENPLIGVGYYRLKAVDIDGSYEYFKVKSVNHGGGRRLLVSPNPTTGSRFSYSINWDPGLYDRISLIDAIGNEVYSAPVTTLQNDLQINKTLRPGAYLLRYTGSSFQEVTRVFIKD